MPDQESRTDYAGPETSESGQLPQSCDSLPLESILGARVVEHVDPEALRSLDSERTNSNNKELVWLGGFALALPVVLAIIYWGPALWAELLLLVGAIGAFAKFAKVTALLKAGLSKFGLSFVSARWLGKLTGLGLIFASGMAIRKYRRRIRERLVMPILRRAEHVSECDKRVLSEWTGGNLGKFLREIGCAGRNEMVAAVPKDGFCYAQDGAKFHCIPLQIGRKPWYRKKMAVRFTGYATILKLPSDTEAIEVPTSSDHQMTGHEIEFYAGKGCLVSLHAHESFFLRRLLKSGGIRAKALLTVIFTDLEAAVRACKEMKAQFERAARPQALPAAAGLEPSLRNESPVAR
ncbi:hypothetical protein NUH88_04825 [Nisaea acidiphila]|uniref:Uncharacterized protein n=1 Tax=Nisaea acidiphila TaxID=1862145 RepID=A0A9J7AUK9_9PROT|nr:hypothetical protein [Nisaea acidiphila]UUX51016.1 hypothetical protein NUH88_04825 [Nisaea acidiphila]